MKNAIMDVVGSHFRPEFVNRIDDLVVFHPLSRDHIRKIVDIQLSYLHDRLADRDIRIHLSDAARDKLADAGFDPVYGARPLKRAIQQQVENPLAQEILQGKFKPGDVIEVSVDDDRLDFRNAA
jgi:ATP-dependent Clp protease ATP-binding subunit ClpB